MREALRQVKPTEFEDLIALVALYRPGPMQYIPVYARRKAGQEPVTYIDPRLEAITGDTYGISIYQEQSMEIAKQIGGFSPADADDLRKAIGKKIHSLMASLKEQFLEGCVANGTTKEVAKQLWDDMEKAQDYSFNKSHAAGYALIAYRTAWLRAHHAHEYMAALISSVMSTKDRVPFYVNACNEMGIEVLPPDVNVSQVDFAVVEGKIRFGLNAVKNVGEAACRAIVAAREEGGMFESIWDFTERVDPQVANKRAVESLVKSGAFDSTGASRMGMVGMLDQALSWGGSEHEARSSRPGLDLRPRRADAGEEKPRHHAPIPPEEYERSELLRLEKETLGLWVSEHPLAEIGAELRRKTDRALADLERCRDGEIVTVGGIVSSVKAADDEEGRPDGLPPPRRPHRQRRGGRLQLGLRRFARALRGRPRADPQGPRRPQGGRVEADRDRGDRVRGVRRAHRGAAEGRRPQGAGRRPARARHRRPRPPGRGEGRARARDLRGPAHARVRPRVPGRPGRRTSTPR